MADDKKYYYLKLKENFYDSEELIILQNMQDGYLYSDILMKLYLRSLKNNGKLMFKDVIPYTPTALAQVVRHQVGTVEKALKIFQELGLIEVLDNGAIYMSDIQNFIGKSSTEADRKRQYRDRIAGEMKLIGQMSDKCPDKNPPEKEKEIEKDIEKDIEIEKENIKEKAQSKKTEVENPRVDNQLLNDKKGRKKETLKKYDEVLNESGLSKKIIKNLKDFIQMRTLIKKPMTNRALELCINDLKKLSNDEETQVKIIEQSIKRNWQGLYPLKEQKNDNKDSTNVFKNLFEEEGNIWRE